MVQVPASKQNCSHCLTGAGLGQRVGNISQRNRHGLQGPQDTLINHGEGFKEKVTNLANSRRVQRIVVQGPGGGVGINLFAKGVVVFFTFPLTIFANQKSNLSQS